MTDQQVAWDSRDKFTTLLISRMELVLNSDQHNIKEWFENLSDFYDIASCAIQDTDKAEHELNKIDKLIYTKVPDRKRKANLEQAYSQMRRFYRQIQKELYEQEILLPFHKRKNIKRAIDNYYETEN